MAVPDSRKLLVGCVKLRKQECVSGIYQLRSNVAGHSQWCCAAKRHGRVGLFRRVGNGTQDQAPEKTREDAHIEISMVKEREQTGWRRAVEALNLRWRPEASTTAPGQSEIWQ